MRIVSGKTLSQTMSNAFQVLDKHGIKQESRNGYALAMFDTTFEFTNPRARHLHLAGRKSNIFQLIAETFWVMAGANSVDGYLEFFLPRAKQYSDDGNTWHGAYGPRMYRHDQIKTAIECFKTDGIDTRRAYIMIADPKLDSQASLNVLYGNGEDDYKGKDIPCNREIAFYVEDNQFHTKVIQRSGDMLFGTGSINPFEFSFLHELVYNEVKKIHPGLILGSYRWHVTNAHVYDGFINQFVEVLNTDQVFNENVIPLIGPAAGPDAWQHFFGSLIAQFGVMISQDLNILESQRSQHGRDLVDLFNQYWIPTDSLLFEYVGLTFDYIVSKRGLETEHFMGRWLQGDLLDAVVHSPFRKFKLVE